MGHLRRQTPGGCGRAAEDRRRHLRRGAIRPRGLLHRETRRGAQGGRARGAAAAGCAGRGEPAPGARGGGVAQVAQGCHRAHTHARGGRLRHPGVPQVALTHRARPRGRGGTRRARRG